MAYTTVERSVLYTLFFLGRPVANPELQKTHKVDLGKASRERLVKDGLISVVEGTRRSNILELARKGREWVCRDIADQPSTQLSPFNATVVYRILNGIAAGLSRQNLSLDKLIKDRDVPPDHMPISDLIKAAYRKVARHPREWVFLSEIRPLIAGASRTEVDSALKSLFIDKKINLTLKEDQKSLTVEQRAAAIRLGVADMHLISME